MIKFTDEMKERIGNAFTDEKFCVWATSSKEGVPSLSIRGSTFVLDDDHMAFWERSRQSGAEHIEENPHVAMFYLDYKGKVGWRFYGEAKLYKEGEMRQKIMDRTIKAELDKDPERKGYGVLIRIDKIRRYSGDQLLQER
jgi:predicted pyridoxine 5'-phosphate oxidase superfamily flavin-nucleotide-binding protein